MEALQNRAHSVPDSVPEVRDILSVITANSGILSGTGLNVINKEMALLSLQTQLCLLAIRPPQFTNVKCSALHWAAY